MAAATIYIQQRANVVFVVVFHEVLVIIVTMAYIIVIT